MAERDCAVVRHFPANAFSSFARSSFVICHASCVTRCSPAASFTHSAKNFAGVTCQKSPYLSATHPHSTSLPPPAVSFSQSRGRGIDLLLRVAVDHERDRFGELEVRSAVQGGKFLPIQLERHRHHLAFLFGKFFAGVVCDLLDLRILEYRDVEICRFFRLIIEPQHWSNFLHASQCA